MGVRGGGDAAQAVRPSAAGVRSSREPKVSEGLMGVQTEQPAAPAPPAQPSRSRVRASWWLIGSAVLAAGLVGGLVGAAVTRGPEPVCDAADVASRGLPSVVTIQAFGAQGQGGAGTGSGEVIRSDGYILTNDHVITPGTGSGGRLQVLFDDGNVAPARIVGRDPLTDLAVLNVDNAGGAEPITLGSSSGLRVGQPVVALGAPLGLSSTVTTGVVSALGRTVRVPSDVTGTALLAAAVQTDAAINPGNSGGALVDCSARLVGVPTAGASVPDGGGGSIGIGFAIPVDSAMRIADQLIANGSVTHAALGIRAGALPAASEQTGLFVVAVEPGAPAEAAGLRQGDVITAIDGVRAADVDQLDSISVTRSPGQTVRLTYKRNGVSSDATVTLGALPSPVS
jgi:putative serine protease PepD